MCFDGLAASYLAGEDKATIILSGEHSESILAARRILTWKGEEEKTALRRNLAERAIDGVFSDRGFSIDSAV